MSRELPKTYDPHAVEAETYRRWEEAGAFSPPGSGEPFCIVLPPPNVTGYLHMGHALDHSIQDAIIRRKRMQGFNALWLPGTDHAGIATQNVVERQLHAEGTDRHTVGREEFIARTWRWRDSSGSIVKRSRRQSTASPSRRICLVIVSPECCFHSHTRLTNPSRPRSKRVLPSSASRRSTTFCVAMPA